MAVNKADGFLRPRRGSRIRARRRQASSRSASSSFSRSCSVLFYSLTNPFDRSNLFPIQGLIVTGFFAISLICSANANKGTACRVGDAAAYVLCGASLVSNLAGMAVLSRNFRRVFREMVGLRFCESWLFCLDFSDESLDCG